MTGDISYELFQTANENNYAWKLHDRLHIFNVKVHLLKCMITNYSVTQTQVTLHIRLRSSVTVE